MREVGTAECSAGTVGSAAEKVAVLVGATVGVVKVGEKMEATGSPVEKAVERAEAAMAASSCVGLRSLHSLSRVHRSCQRLPTRHPDSSRCLRTLGTCWSTVVGAGATEVAVAITVDKGGKTARAMSARAMAMARAMAIA